MPKKQRTLNFFVVFFSCAILFLLCTSFVLAATAKLNWTAPTTNADGSALTDLAGYKVYWGTASNNYTSDSGTNVVAGTAYTASNISDTGTTYFTVSAKDNTGNESTKATEVYKIPGDVDKNNAVNSLDVRQVVLNWNKSASASSTPYADINLDGTVNSLDIRAVILNWNYTK